MRAHSRIPAIIRVVAEHYVVTPAEIRCDRYPRRFSEPRHVGMWLAEKLTDASLPEIGKAFGGRHHATVIYGIERVEARRKDAEFQEQLDALVLQIRAMPPAPCSPESLLRQLIEAKEQAAEALLAARVAMQRIKGLEAQIVIVKEVA